MAPKDIDEAEQWLRKDLESNGLRDVQFNLTNGQFSYKDSKQNSYGLNLATLVSTSLSRDDKSGLWRVTYVSYQSDKPFYWQNRSRDRAERFEAALRFLVQQCVRNIEAATDAELKKFNPQAETWRALAQKPKMPDDAYAHKVLAEAAYRDKNLQKAMVEYALALQAFPTWPEGQFNAALIGAELKYYRGAVLHMQEYLALVPDAPDAQAAKDKIIIWKDKTTHP